jgi:hypothetical protein
MRKLTLGYYSVSKDEYIAIEDMNLEHLVNVIYKSIEKADEYNANFRVINNTDGAIADASLKITGVLPSFLEDALK